MGSRRQEYWPRAKVEAAHLHWGSRVIDSKRVRQQGFPSPHVTQRQALANSLVLCFPTIPGTIPRQPVRAIFFSTEHGIRPGTKASRNNATSARSTAEFCCAYSFPPLAEALFAMGGECTTDCAIYWGVDATELEGASHPVNVVLSSPHPCPHPGFLSLTARDAAGIGTLRSSSPRTPSLAATMRLPLSTARAYG